MCAHSAVYVIYMHVYTSAIPDGQTDNSAAFNEAFLQSLADVSGSAILNLPTHPGASIYAITFPVNVNGWCPQSLTGYQLTVQTAPGSPLTAIILANSPTSPTLTLNSDGGHVCGVNITFFNVSFSNTFSRTKSNMLGCVDAKQLSLAFNNVTAAGSPGANVNTFVSWSQCGSLTMVDSVAHDLASVVDVTTSPIVITQSSIYNIDTTAIAGSFTPTTIENTIFNNNMQDFYLTIDDGQTLTMTSNVCNHELGPNLIDCRGGTCNFKSNHGCEGIPGQSDVEMA